MLPPSSGLTPFASPYEGKRAALATMHRKEEAIAPALTGEVGLSLVVPRGINTDALGTFTGEILRQGTMREAAYAKARLGMAASGLPFGVASEGSYGPHPHFPLLAGGIELMVFIDDQRHTVVWESAVVDQTNFNHQVTREVSALGDFLQRVGFPEHGLVVSPNVPTDSTSSFTKGIRRLTELERAIRTQGALSSDGQALVQTDMRAHQNPTRMKAIAGLAWKMAQRLCSLCPRCQAPGFGPVDVIRGLPCEGCGVPSALVKAELFGCPACDHSESRPRPDGLETADPSHCLFCNP